MFGPDMHASKVIDVILAEHLAPLMKSLGFRRKGQRFWREVGQFFDELDLQKQWFNTKTHARFTINLGVYFPPVGGWTGGRVSVMPPKEYECTIGERIGFLFGKHLDFWWEVRGIRQAPAIGKDLCEKITRFGVPWLEAMHDLRAMLRYNREHPTEFAEEEVRRYLRRKRRASNPSLHRMAAPPRRPAIRGGAEGPPSVS
jgi:hypothetical protein